MQCQDLVIINWMRLNKQLPFSDCKTIRVISSFNPDPGKKCIFPFIYKDEKFNGCTQEDYNGTYWCPTELLADGSIQKSSSKWGTCENKCHKEGKYWL